MEVVTGSLRAVDPFFDPVARAFTECLRFATDWEQNYDGYFAVDKLKLAIVDLKLAIETIERSPQLKGKTKK